MFDERQLNLALENINLLIENARLPSSRFRINNGKISKNLFFKNQSSEELKTYLQGLINEFANSEADFKNPLFNILFINLQYFFNLKPNNVIEKLNLDFKQYPYLKRNQLNLNKFNHTHKENNFNEKIQGKHPEKLPEILYNPKTKHYTSPDDDRAHQHGKEAGRIFFATQSERFKALLNSLFSRLGIYIFEPAQYKERKYLESDIYAHHTGIQLGCKPEKQAATHYWIGHASNFITIPTDLAPLHVLTDPVEGDLAPLLYPRMTKEGSLINGVNEERLPRVDAVIISHNHRDHVSERTLKDLVEQQPIMIVPEGTEVFFKNLGFTQVVGLKWWEQATICDEKNNELLRVTGVPTRHWSGRGMHDAHRSAFNGYVLSSSKLEGDIYFAGDTALMKDEISQSIFKEFNIITSIQPGGPDEGRKDMESTHQSSADAILMHFKILAARYQKLKDNQKDEFKLSTEEFLDSCNVKTIYNHTSTFKLGNLRLKDSFFSHQRILAAFQESPEWFLTHLPEHEQHVVLAIRDLVKTMKFSDKTLTDAQIANEILHAIVIPKIGQRQPLHFSAIRGKANHFSYRNLITNGRALENFDTLLQDHVLKLKGKFSSSQFLDELLENYQHPWHSSFSRNTKAISIFPYVSEIRNCENDEKLLQILNRMESNLGKLNTHGHMQSLIHYAKWVINFNQQHASNDTKKELKDYFICQQIRQLVDEESQNKGSFFKLTELFKHSRTEKQKLFQKLADELVNLPEGLKEYRNTFSHWLTSNPSAKQILTANRSRLFGRSKPRSEEVLHKIDEYVNKP